jgi:fatty acid desaturase
MGVGFSYIGAYGLFMVPHFGWLFSALTLLVINIHFAFLLDRLREGIEHNLMPLERANGTRNFGWGFWGMLIGGGPWGQSCHLSHHLAPMLPWYHQLLLHRTLQRILTPAQREVFFLRPVTGFPWLVGRIFKQSWSLASKA